MSGQPSFGITAIIDHIGFSRKEMKHSTPSHTHTPRRTYVHSASDNLKYKRLLIFSNICIIMNDFYILLILLMQSLELSLVKETKLVAHFLITCATSSCLGFILCERNITV